MALDIWTEKSGHSLGVFPERINILSFKLPALNLPDVKFSLLSGKLPSGLTLSDTGFIIGTPLEVAKETEFTFCIRASAAAIGISDRTFKMTVVGANSPVFATPPGYLNLNNDSHYYTIDNAYVDFQIIATDPDVAAGQTLKFFMTGNDGSLPPGLSLTEDGRITGFVKPLLTLKKTDGIGTYDSGLYDSTGYDFAITGDKTGYDMTPYDFYGYDFTELPYVPKKLNRNYEFTVSVTDGMTVTKRKFSIYVMANDYFRSDNTVLLSDSVLFSSDAAYLVAPRWKTGTDLGRYTADNYVTIKLDVYDEDYIIYQITNESKLPPGMQFDEGTSTIYGYIPYQSYISKKYYFEVSAIRPGLSQADNTVAKRTFLITIDGQLNDAITWHSDSVLGTLYTSSPSTLAVEASVDNNTEVSYSLADGSGQLPPGITLSVTGDLIGNVNTAALTFFDFVNSSPTTFDNDSTSIDRKFTFTVLAHNRYVVGDSTKTFSVRVEILDYQKYSNIYAIPLFIPQQRQNWDTFISNINIFDPTLVYRFGDENFGISTTMKVMLYGGIETVHLSEVLQAVSFNSQKRLVFGEVSKAVATDPVTFKELYEVVYVKLIDPAVSVNNPRVSKYLNSVPVWRKNISDLGHTERQYLPLWMRSIQPNERSELNFELAAPLCYCKVGQTNAILNNIKNSGFDFKSLDFIINKVMVTSTLESSTNQFLIFGDSK